MGQLFINLANSLISGFGSTLQVIHDVLPSSPFAISMNFLSKYLGWLNYLLPIAEAVAILEIWCSCILVWYVYQIVLRWLKAID